MATDPVCGMFVDERSATLKLVRDNRTYSFCSNRCFQEFAQPEREMARLLTRLAVGWPASIVIVFLTYGQPFPPWPWVALLLASIVQFYPGWQFYVGTRDAIRGRNWNMDILIAIGTTAAFAYSVAALVLPARLPAAYYFDASAIIITLILTGNYLEHLTRERARGALRRLNELLPTTALLLRNGKEFEVPVSEVKVGDRFRVRPGARFPTDGSVLEGRSSVNEAVLTGESMPVEKSAGTGVIAGSVNGEGPLTVQATKVGEDTALAQIGRLMTEAETSRVPLQQQADRIATVFVPLVLLLAIGASLAWALLGVGFTVALLVFVSVVIIACPCAFGIATPAAIVAGTARAAEEGILFKGRDSLEQASRVDLVLTDKTGTLTRGEPILTDTVTTPGTTEHELLSLAAALESGSEHPLARAVVRAAEARDLQLPAADAIRADPGRGIRGRVAGAEVAVLNERAALEDGARLNKLQRAIDRLTSEGRGWSVVLRDSTPIGLLGFFDEVAPGVHEAIQTLAADGISVVMVTGDHPSSAQTVAREAGIAEVHASMTPGAKLALIRELRKAGRKVAYVGDGINDAPALAEADLGIAIGSGTDVAREAGGVILIRSDFRGVALALRVGRRTLRKVRGNLTWAIGYNAALLPVAMGALVPVFGLGVFQTLPIAAAIAMALSSTTVVLNSLSLRKVRLDTPAGRAVRPLRINGSVPT
ncbi:heavy metal-transporting ATPase [mine drainage metagenome]|uniref:Heavy metal-transporting ATPase n=1 Tax=mine drainage metagenome TaxID=410659 RepID=T1D7M5_9ZZZZ